jgi:hypothetical protein
MLLAAVASICTGVQLGVLALGGPEVMAQRGQGTSLPALAMVSWMRGVVLPVFGAPAALASTNRFGPRLLPFGAEPAPSMLIVAWLLLATLVLLIAILALGAPRQVRWWLAGAYGVVTVGSFAGARGGARGLLGGVEGGARYGFVPGVLLVWLLLMNVRWTPRAEPRLRDARAVAIGIGAWHWRETLRMRASWPVWSEEVAAWRGQPRYPLRIWPRGWTMQLVPRR